MLPNLFEAQRMAEQRMRDSMREAEQHRMVQAARGPRKPREWRFPVALILSSLSTLFIRLRIRHVS